MEEVHINTAEIPEWYRYTIGKSTCEMILRIIRTPGGREALNARTAERKAAQAAARKESGYAR